MSRLANGLVVAQFLVILLAVGTRGHTPQPPGSSQNLMLGGLQATVGPGHVHNSTTIT